MSRETGSESLLGRVVENNRGLLRSLSRGWSRFTTHKLGVSGLVILVAMVVMAVGAPYIAPHDLDWTAPSDVAANECDTLTCVANSNTHPAGPRFGDPYFAPLGTNDEGQGILSKLIYGSRTALYIGLAAGLLSSLVGIPLGLISGFYGDTWIDETIQRLIDIFWSLPFLPLVIVLVAINGITTTNIIIAIVVRSWLNNAVIIRGETLSLKERSYIEAAKVSGASDNRIIFRHILPNVLPLGFIYLAQDAAFAVLTQASLAYLGLADFTNVSWGTMLQQIQTTGNVYSAPWWLIPPGLMITAMAASFYFVGYSLEDVMNPQTSS